MRVRSLIRHSLKQNNTMIQCPPAFFTICYLKSKKFRRTILIHTLALPIYWPINIAPALAPNRAVICAGNEAGANDAAAFSATSNCILMECLSL